MLSQDEIARYARHIKLNNVGLDGQEKLKNASVLVVGAGGLGCPVLQYLTAAGVGTIGIIDDDIVDASNLQRQIIYDVNDVGQSKVESAIRKLSAQNPYVKFIAHTERLTNQNALDVLQPYDIILDGTDNFPTRYLVGDACTILNKPLVFGSIFKFEGQLSVFNYQNGPSYRCMFPDPPAQGEVPNCSDVGVFGVLPGVIGTRMATECIKMILELGEILSGKLFVTDLLGNQNLHLAITKNDDNFKRSSLEEDYEDFCGIIEIETNLASELTATELHEKMKSGVKFQFVDVREPFETQICQLEGSIFIPLGTIPNHMSKISKEVPTVMICHHGIRSAHAIQFLEGQGFSNLINLEGGIHAWALDVHPEMQRY